MYLICISTWRFFLTCNHPHKVIKFGDFGGNRHLVREKALFSSNLKSWLSCNMIHRNVILKNVAYLCKYSCALKWRGLAGVSGINTCYIYQGSSKAESENMSQEWTWLHRIGSMLFQEATLQGSLCAPQCPWKACSLVGEKLINK